MELKEITTTSARRRLPNVEACKGVIHRAWEEKEKLARAQNVVMFMSREGKGCYNTFSKRGVEEKQGCMVRHREDGVWRERERERERERAKRELWMVLYYHAHVLIANAPYDLSC